MVSWETCSCGIQSVGHPSSCQLFVSGWYGRRITVISDKNTNQVQLTGLLGLITIQSMISKHDISYAISFVSQIPYLTAFVRTANRFNAYPPHFRCNQNDKIPTTPIDLNRVSLESTLRFIWYLTILSAKAICGAFCWLLMRWNLLKHVNTVGFRNKALQCNMILPRALQWLKQNTNQSLNMHTTSHIAQLQASYKVSLVSIWETMDRVMIAWHCIQSFLVPILQTTDMDINSLRILNNLCHDWWINMNQQRGKESMP